MFTSILDQFATVPFSLSFSFGGLTPPAPIPGYYGTVQAVNTDPTNIPSFRNTVAQRLCWAARTTCYTLGDDDAVLHTVLPGNEIHFASPIGGGQTSMFIGSNGVISFGGPSTDFQESMSKFFDGFTPGYGPGIAVCWTDLNRGGVNSGATYCVIEEADGRVYVVLGVPSA